MITPFGELPNRLARDMSLQEQHDWLQTRVSRRAVLGGLGALGLAGAGLWAQPAYANTPEMLFGRQLAYGEDPTTQMIVRFASTSAFTRANVIASASGAPTVSADVTVEGVRATTARYGQAVLRGLIPGTRYDYSIIVAGKAQAQGTLTTAPAGAHPFRFTAFGDQGVAADAARLLVQVAKLAPQLHLVTGDLSYADSSGRGGPGDSFHPAVWDLWLRQNQNYTSNIPWMFALGNHEMEPGFDLHGYAGVLSRLSIGGKSPLGVPAASQYTVGNVGFIALDSNDVSYEFPANRGWTKGAQTTWLRDTLSTLRAPGSGVDFIVVYLHHGAYSTSNAHGSEGGIRESWVPLFDAHNVDLVISGHNHCYERTLPLRAGNVIGSSPSIVSSQLATTYITAGGGGQPAANLFLNGARPLIYEGSGVVREAAPWSLPTRTAAHAVLCVDVTPAAAVGQLTTMRLRAIDEQGAVRDEVVLQRPGTVAAGSVRQPASGGSDLAPILIGGAAAVASATIAGLTLSRRAQHRKDPPPNSPTGPPDADATESDQRPFGP